jgi:hypothetical protein
MKVGQMTRFVQETPETSEENCYTVYIREELLTLLVVILLEPLMWLK